MHILKETSIAIKDSVRFIGQVAFQNSTKSEKCKNSRWFVIWKVFQKVEPSHYFGFKTNDQSFQCLLRQVKPSVSLDISTISIQFSLLLSVLMIVISSNDSKWNSWVDDPVDLSAGCSTVPTSMYADGPTSYPCIEEALSSWPGQLWFPEQSSQQ